MKTCRQEFARGIAAAIDEGKARGLEGKALRSFVRDNSGWSWFPANYHRRIFLDEVRRQLGLKRKPNRVEKPMPLFPGGDA